MKKKCYECNGTGLIGSYHDVKCYECKGKGYIKPYWEEEFEDMIEFISDEWQSGMYFSNKHGIGDKQEYIADWFNKYIGLNKVKIKARKGKIVIERI